MTTILTTVAGIGAYTGLCWLLFVKVWPRSQKPSKRHLEWPEEVFTKKPSKPIDGSSK